MEWRNISWFCPFKFTLFWKYAVPYHQERIRQGLIWITKYRHFKYIIEPYDDDVIHASHLNNKHKMTRFFLSVRESMVSFQQTLDQYKSPDEYNKSPDEYNKSPDKYKSADLSDFDLIHGVTSTPNRQQHITLQT